MEEFSKFFNSWLHDGYYKNYANIGKNGDFFTAISVGNLFGSLLAKHFLDLVNKNILKLPLQIVEIGANEGYLMHDFVSALISFDKNIFKDIEIFIVEPHEKLRNIQKNTLKDIEFTHIKNLNDYKFINAFIFCNELFDSFSCELIENEKMVFVDENKNLHFLNAKKDILKKCEKIELLKGEFSQELENFFEILDKSCEKFIFNTFDYGVKYPNKFSIRIYKEHQVYSFFDVNLNNYYKISDLTYNINFTHLKYLIKKFNYQLLSYKKQNLALIDFGFEQLLNDSLKINETIYNNFLKQAKNLFFNFDDKFHFIEFQKGE